MPHAPLAGNAAVTGTRDQAGPPDTPAPAPVTPGHGPRKARSPLARRAARRAQTVLPAIARSDRTGSARAEIRGDRLRRVVGLLRRVPKTGASCHDPLFERPDLIEDDYYRLRNQPHG
jgi:hypothetical protein